MIRTTERPCSRRSRSSRRRIPACTVTSSAVVGSSAISSRGRHASAIAIAMRCRIPPENWCGYACSALSGSGMRTSSQQLERARVAASRRRARGGGARARSAACPIESIGCSDVIGSWKTIAISRPEIRRSSRGAQAQQVACPRTPRAPPTTAPGRQQAEQREHRHRLAAAALAGDRRRPRPARRGSRSPSTTVAGPAGVGSRTRRPSTSSSGAHSRSATRRAVRGSKTSRRLSPRKLNASTAVKIASPGNVPIHHHWKYCAPSRPSSPTRRAAAARRGRGTRARRAAGSRCRGRASRARAPGPTTFGSTSRTSVRRAEAPSRRDA